MHAVKGHVALATSIALQPRQMKSPLVALLREDPDVPTQAGLSGEGFKEMISVAKLVSLVFINQAGKLQALALPQVKLAQQQLLSLCQRGPDPLQAALQQQPLLQPPHALRA
ncbi:hypothetical protein N7513_006166 [Penicillium frequentans]|nr:hypothetical protein N7513_006166 [Penicillium glabrum]